MTLVAIPTLLLAETSVAKGPEWGDQAFQAPSIYRPEDQQNTPLKDQVVVVFHGFKSAMPNKTLDRVQALFGTDYSFVGVNYNYFAVSETVEFLNGLKDNQLAGKQIFTVGTSLGGYWANWFGVHADAQGIVVANPVVSPAEQMLQFVGTGQLSERRNLIFDVTPEDVAQYRGLESAVGDRPETLVILVHDDEVIDTSVALQYFGLQPNVTIKTYEVGGHSIDLVRHKAGLAIKGFFLTQN